MATASQESSLPPVARRALRARIVGMVVITAVSCAALSALVSIYGSYAQVRRQLDETSPLLLERCTRSVAERLESAQAEVVALAGSDRLAQALSEAAAVRGQLDGNATAQVLGAALDGSGGLEALLAVDPNGDVIGFAGSGASLGALLDLLEPKNALEAQLEAAMLSSQWRKQLGGSAAGLRVWESAEAAESLLASAPVAASEAVVHGLVAREALVAALPTELPSGVGELALIDSAGGLVGKSQAGGASSSDGIDLGGALNDLGGVWSLRYALSVEPIGWSVVAEAHLLDALRGPALALARSLAVTLALAAVFAVVAHRRSTRQLRPLWLLYEAMRRGERGEAVEEVPARGATGEVESLILVFNALRRRLEAQRVEMERANRALNEQNQAFQQKHQTLSKLSVTDSLTKLANRRFFENQLDKEIRRLARTSEGLSMLIIDIDDFKKLNDSFGHAAGDEFLRQIANILTEGVRATDLVARYGGEEFVVVATGTGLEGAEILGEKVCTAVAEASFIVDESMRPRHATISVGVAEYSGSQTDLFNSADAALYQAKASGKNCVCTAPRSKQGDEDGDVG